MKVLLVSSSSGSPGGGQIYLHHLAVGRELCPDVVHINQQAAEDGLDLVLAARESGVRPLGRKLGRPIG